MTLVAAGAVLALSSAHAQSFFSSAPAPVPVGGPARVQGAPPAAEVATARRGTVGRKKQARRSRALLSSRSYARATARDVERDTSKDGQHGRLGARVNGNTIALMSGGLDATSTAVAADLATLLDDGDNLRILPVLGKGGGQNIRDLRFMKDVDLAIIRANLLEASRRSGAFGAIDDRIVYVAKLFDEELHILVRADSGIASIEQLAGQRVNFGDAGSGSDLTVRELFGRLGVEAVEVNLRHADALQKLRKGDIAAVALIAGKPAAALAQLSAEGFRLLPVAYSRELQTEYLPTSLGPQDYPALIGPQRSVDTVAVPAVLVAYNWPKGSDRYRRIEAFVEAFFPRLADFQRAPRHPKWREANVAAILPGWTRFPAADEWLRRAAAQARHESVSSGRLTTAMDVLTGSGATRGAAPEVDHLFTEFLRWNESRERR